MKPSSNFTHSAYRAGLFFFIMFLCFNSSYSQVSDADKAKKDTRSLLVQLQNSEVAKSTLTTKKVKLDVKEKGIMAEAKAIIEKQAIHDRNVPAAWDDSKSKPQYAIDYDNEKTDIENEKADILKRLNAIQAEKDLVKTSMDSLNYVTSSQRGLLKLKSIKIKTDGLFNTTNCGQMPGEIATVLAWKSYLDCLFDGVPRNLPGFNDPVNPGNTIMIPNDPDAHEQKLKAIKILLEESKNNNKPRQAIVVPSPEVNNSNERGGSLSATLKSLINQFKNKN